MQFYGTIIALFLGSASAMATPIPMFGSGSWVQDPFAYGGMYNMYGTNGVDTAQVVYSGLASSVHQSLAISNLLAGCPAPYCRGVINGVTGVFFTVGDGTLTIYDSARNPIDTVDIAAYIQITSETDTLVNLGGTFVISSQGTFDIIPTPEPVSFAMIGVGLAAVFICKRKTTRNRINL
jgi:hypothetical protein